MTDLKKEMKDNGIPYTPGMSSRDVENALAQFYWKQRYPNKPPPDIIDPMLIKKFSDLDDAKQEDIWKSEEWFAEVKRNGLRIIWNIGSKHRFTTRGRSVKTFLPGDVSKAFFWLNHQMPEMEGTILDGEVISVDKTIDMTKHTKGKGEVTNNVLQAAMALVSSENTVAAQKENGMPLRYVVYDILKYKGENVSNKPYLERRKLLSEFYDQAKGKAGDKLILNDSTNKDKKDFYQDVINKGGEGIVLKKGSGIYEPGTRTGDQLKVKRSEEVDAVVTGFTPPKSKTYIDAGLVGGLEFSVKDITDGKWYVIGNVSNFSQEFRKSISVQDDKGQFKDITPETYGMVFEVQGQEWNKNALLSHMRIVRARVGVDSKSADEAVFDRQAVLRSIA